MYDPTGNGKDKAVQSVHFVEAEPPSHLRGIVHRFLELKTVGALSEDYRFHALPDACPYIVFDQLDRNITGASKLRAQSEEFNLGRAFHFVNIRFLPGVWQSSQVPLSFGMVDKPYEGDLPLIDVNQDLSNRDFIDQQPILARLVDTLIESKVVAANPITEGIFQNLDEIASVADVSEVAGVGGFVKQYQVDVDPNALLAHSVTLDKVIMAVKEGNIDVGAKVIEEGGMEFIVRGVGFVKGVDDIEDIVVAAHDGVPVYVKNVATVTLDVSNAIDNVGPRLETGRCALSRRVA